MEPSVSSDKLMFHRKKIFFIIIGSVALLAYFYFIDTADTGIESVPSMHAGEVIAGVNNVSIFEDDLKRALLLVGPKAEAISFRELKEKVLGDLIDVELVRQEAEKDSPSITGDEAVNRLLKKIMNKVMVGQGEASDEAYENDYGDARFRDGYFIEKRRLAYSKALDKFKQRTNRLRKASKISINHDVLEKLMITAGK